MSKRSPRAYMDLWYRRSSWVEEQYWVCAASSISLGSESGSLNVAIDVVSLFVSWSSVSVFSPSRGLS